MKACVLANTYVNEKFSLDVEGVEKKSRKQRENAATSSASRTFSGQSEKRLKISEVESGHFFYKWTFEDLGEILIVFWTRKGMSLNFFQLFSMLTE